MRECDLKLMRGELDGFLLNFDLIAPLAIARYFEAHQVLLEHAVAHFLYGEAMAQIKKRGFSTEEHTQKNFDLTRCAPCVSWCLELLMSYEKQNSSFFKGFRESR